ncbi:MAG TPA: methyladenine dioxygenase, partial [Vicinamibacteria bacterium]
MPQIPLFEAREDVLADDTRGRITYTPAFVSPPVAEAWFAELRQAAPWKAERRRMYDREVDVPRLTAHYRLDGPVPGAIAGAAREVAAATGVPFNGVGLNLYRDGRDSVAAHNDHLYELVEGFPIALLSLGATRRMVIRAKEPP